MDRFVEAANALLDCFWDKDVVAEAATKPTKFDNQLAQLEHHAAARKLRRRKPLHEPITSKDVQHAKGFARHIYKPEPPTEKGIVLEKRLNLRSLDYTRFSILAVLYHADDLIKLAASTFKALLEGVGKIAEWSTWPRNPELINTLRQWKPAPAALVTLSVASEVVQPPPNPAQPVIEPSVPCTAPTRFQPAPLRAAVPPSSPGPATGAPDTACTALPTRPQPASRWVLTCSFCATVVRPRCACEHATASTTTSASSPPGIASTNTPVPPPANLTASDARPDHNHPASALPPTIRPTAPTDATPTAALSLDTGAQPDATPTGSDGVAEPTGQPRKRPRVETDALDGTAVTIRLPALTGNSSDLYAAVPYYGRPSPGQTLTSQLGGTESRGRHPGAVGPSAGQCSNVPPDQPVSAPRPSQLSGTSVQPLDNADTTHPIEGFSELIRYTVLSTHSSERLVEKIQHINGNIRFEHRSD
ncbi:hypothetical protein VTK26DRAFT_3416 [Humicola hyalothermophila]